MTHEHERPANENASQPTDRQAGAALGRLVADRDLSLLTDGSEAWPAATEITEALMATEAANFIQGKLAAASEYVGVIGDAIERADSQGLNGREGINELVLDARDNRYDTHVTQLFWKDDIVDEVRAASRAESIEGVAHLKAFQVDAAHGYAIAVKEQLRGGNIATLLPTSQQREQILSEHPEQMLALIDTAIQMHKAGLVLDAQPSNLVYDRESGFGVTNYRLANERNGTPSLAAQVFNLRRAIAFPDDRLIGSDRHMETSFTSQNERIVGAFVSFLEKHQPEIVAQAAKEKDVFVYDPDSSPEGQTLREQLERLGLLHQEQPLGV